MTANTVASESDDLATTSPTAAFAEADARRPSCLRRGRQAAGSASARLRRRAKAALRGVAAVIFVAAVSAVCYESWLLAQQRQRNLATAQAVDAAANYAVTLTSTSTDTIDQNITDILNGATGEFKDRYTKASSRLRQALIEYKVSTRGVVVDSAVKAAVKDRVDTVLLVQESVTNSMSHDPHTELTAVRITMERVNGRWLASKVAVLPE